MKAQQKQKEVYDRKHSTPCKFVVSILYNYVIVEIIAKIGWDESIEERFQKEEKKRRKIR